MHPPLKLCKDERLWFMQALDAVAGRDGSPSNAWKKQLDRLGELFMIDESDYRFQAGAPGIAEKVNQIESPKVRLYFLRIIHDIHLLELKFLFRPWDESSLKNFDKLYSKLVEMIRVD